MLKETIENYDIDNREVRELMSKKIHLKTPNCNEDINFITKVIKNSEANPFPKNDARTKKDIEKIINSANVKFFIIETLDNKQIGIADLYYKIVKNTADEEIKVCISEIGLLEESDRRKKYGTEAMLNLLDYGFEDLGLENVYSTINEGNDKSRKFHESLGYSESTALFKPEIAKEHSKKYKISKEDWEEKRKEILKILDNRETK